VTVAGLVLAAGEGRRLGGPKALLELAGERLVDRATRTLHEGGCQSVVVVSGAASFEVAGATVVDNAAWRTGMGSSLRTGLAALVADHDVDAAVVVVVDTPGIGPAVVRRLVAAYERGAGAVVATYDGKPRNPVLLGRQHWAAAAERAVGDIGARAFLRANLDVVSTVECGDIGDPRDVDTVEEWQAIRGE
jgi:nicotine blue oxidoreductase